MIKIKRSRTVLGLVLLVYLASCRPRIPESTTLTAFSNRDNTGFRALYFYPSTIRMLGRAFGDSTGSFLNEIHRGRLFFTLSDSVPLIKATFDELSQGVAGEGFQVLMEMRSPGSRVSAWMREGNVPDYVVFMNGSNGTLIMEVAGNLSAASLRQLSTLDLSKAAGFLDILPAEEPKDTKAENDTLPNYQNPANREQYP